MSKTAVQTMRLVNRHLRPAVTRLQCEQERCGAIAPTEFADLLGELRHASDCLRNLPVASLPDDEMAREVSEYKSHLAQLRNLLPSAHGRLLIEKARLENARVHVARAAAWTQARAKTL